MNAPRGASPEPPASSPSALAETPPDEKARARARVGQTINAKWRLDALLGVGGMASVYAATHRNGSRAALKILHTEFAREAGIRERFLREGYVANRIDHRGRVAILDDDVTESDEPFLVMELLEGETLQQLWKRKNRRVPPVEALSIAAEMLDTLASFHSEGIVHRDIKPANIFICRDTTVKLLDFGVARMRDASGDKTRAGTALGTPSFMAPEQAMGLAEGVDGRADVFSIGATLFALVGGQRLHQGRSDNEAFILAATTPAPSLARIAPELPIEVIALIDKALAWDKRNRFQTAGDMRAEVLRLIDVLGGEARSSAKAPSRPERAITDAPPAESVELVDLEAERELEPSHPSVQRLIDVFRRIERLLPAVRHYGWEHPESDGKLRASFQGMLEALREEASGIRLKLSPYAFSFGGQPIWEPTAPLDAVPYHLFAAGVRRIVIRPGFTEAELRSLLTVMLLDPSDLSPGDDVAAALWEQRLEHVRYDAINAFAEGDAADREAFWGETDDVEADARQATEDRANRAEAAAMAVETDRKALRAAKEVASVLALDPIAKKALGAQLAMSIERWNERFIDVLAHALIDAHTRNDTALVLEPLDAWARELVATRRFAELFSMHEALVKVLSAYAPRDAAALGAELASGLLSPEGMRALVREATRPPPLGVAAVTFGTVNLDAIGRGLEAMLAPLGSTHVEAALDVAMTTQHEGLRRVLFGYLERTLPGREIDVVDRVLALDVESARLVLRLFAISRTPTAVDALRRIATLAKPDLRCEAIAALAESQDELRDQLVPLAENADPALRFAAVRTLAHHQVRGAGPLLARRVQDPTFHQLSIEERREVLSALFALHAARAETIAIDLLQKHGLLGTDAAIEQTRAITAELLGRHAQSMPALEAVVGGLKRRWWNSQLLRDAASAAAEAIAARLGKRISPAGDIVS